MEGRGRSLQDELLGEQGASVQALSPSGRTTSGQFRRAWNERRLPSGKMVLDKLLLARPRDRSHLRQMTRILTILEDFCEFRQFNHERLDGSITGNKRQEAIDRFNMNDDSFIFLLSTRAGGVGINLTAADTCIIFDSDWNPQNDVQAQARCHRIGRRRKFYRLITHHAPRERNVRAREPQARPRARRAGHAGFAEEEEDGRGGPEQFGRAR